MYFHEVKDHLDNGGKVKRLSWGKAWMCKKEAGPMDLNPEEKEKAGLNPKAEVVTEGEYLLCQDADNALYGYSLTAEDKSNQDWEVTK